VKISILVVQGLSGGVKVIGILADKLARRGHDVTLITIPARVPSLKSKIKQFLRGRGWPKSKRGSLLDRFPVPKRPLPHWRPVVDDDVPDGDIVVATWWETVEWVSHLSPSKGARVFFVQGHETFTGASSDQVRAAYQAPFHKIAVSRWLADLMRTEYGDSRVTVAPNAVDPAQFFAPPRGKQPRPTVGLIYADAPVKAIDVGLRALEIVRRDLPDLQVVSFGTRQPPEEFTSRPGVTHVLLPEQDKIRDLHARCDVWMMCSRSEGFGLPVIEAMACRCPVVSTRSGGPQDLIQDGVNGFLAEVGDSEGLARRLLDVLRRPDKEWRAMSDAAHATASARTWDDTADKFEEGLRVALER
jgi:glycosyltransferase involved in cell wall biosynthesis